MANKKSSLSPAIFAILIILGLSLQYPLIFAILFSIITIIVIAYLYQKSKEKNNNSYYIETDPLPEYAGDRLPNPEDNEYSYYTIVGMQYHGIQQQDLGIHLDAEAIAEPENRYDSYAVAICNNKKIVAYVPKDQNKALNKYIMKNGGSTPARYRIWIREDRFYGIAYIKDGGIGNINEY